MKKKILIVIVCIVIIAIIGCLIIEKKEREKISVNVSQTQLKQEEKILNTAIGDLSENNREELRNLLSDNTVGTEIGRKFLESSLSVNVISAMNSNLGKFENYKFIDAYEQKGKIYYNFTMNFENIKDVKVNMACKDDKIEILNVNGNNGTMQVNI